MKWDRPTRIEWYSFLVSMPLIDFGLNHILYKGRLFTEYRIWLISLPLLWIMGIVTWYFHVLYSHFVQRKFPELNQSTQRILLKALVNLFVMSPSILLIFLFYDQLHFLGYSSSNGDLLKGLVVGIAVNLVFSTLWEAMYIMDKQKESIAEREL